MDSYSHLALSSCHFLRDCPRSSEIMIWSIPRRFRGSGIHIVPEPMLLGLKCVLGITSIVGEKSQPGRSRDGLILGPVCLFFCFLFSYQILVILSHSSSDLDIWPCFQFFEWTLAPYSVLLRIHLNWSQMPWLVSAIPCPSGSDLTGLPTSGHSVESHS